MKNELLGYQDVYQNASLGMYGHKIFVVGETSNPDHNFLCITAIEDSIISYDKAEVAFDTFGDSSVTNLELKAGVILIVGAVKNIAVTGGKIFANLLTRP